MLIKDKIIIDTDPGHDDAMALMMIASEESLEIKAITTVCGNSSIENTTRNAFFVLNLIGREDIPVYPGANKPLKRALVKAIVHGESGLEGAPLDKKAIEVKENAFQKIIEIVKKHPNQITILTLGPLTNIAKAIITEPSLPKLIKRIVIMGGAINVPGNKNRVAEFNIFVDPDAAAVVFRANVLKVLVPLDSCNDIVLSRKDITKIANTKVGSVLKKMLEPYIKNIALDEGTSGALMYDPLAAYYLINPNAFEAEEMDIEIETEGEFTSGMTVAERRPMTRKDFNCEVVTKINGEKFKKDFINAVNGLGDGICNSSTI